MSSKNFVQKIKRGIIFHTLILFTFLTFLSSCYAMEEDETPRKDVERNVKKVQPSSSSAEGNNISQLQSRIHSSLSCPSDGALHNNDPNKEEGQVEIINREEGGRAEESKEYPLNPMRGVTLDTSRNDSPPYLISDEAKKEAVSLYKQGLKCEEDEKIEDATNLYLRSVKMGFVLSAFRLHQIQFVKLIKLINEKQTFFDMERSKFTNQEGRGESLQTLLDLEIKILKLNIKVADIQEDWEILTDLVRNGNFFSMNIVYSYANNLNTFLIFDMKQLVSKSLQEEKKARRMLLELIDKKVERLQKSILILDQTGEVIKTREAVNFIKEVNEIIKNSLSSLQQLQNRFEDDTGNDKDMLLSEIAEPRLLRKNDKILVNKILKIVKRYTTRDYMFSSIILEDIRQVRNALLTILVAHNYAFAGGNQLLWKFSGYFIAAHDNLEIPDDLDRLKARLIILREAERYPQAVENPQKYIQLTDPEEYKRIKYDSPHKKALFQQHYDNHPSFPDLISDLRLKVFLNNLRDRANLYTLELLNRSYQLYNEPFLKGEAPLALSSLRKRSIGLGPAKTTIFEVSPWVDSLNYFWNLKEGLSYEFVFDIASSRLHILKVPIEENKKNSGHCYIKDYAAIQRPCGGNIKRIGEALFRTDEFSGHYGLYWTDRRRLRFLMMLSTIDIRHKKFQVIHEPWMSDEDRAERFPNLLPKIGGFMPVEETLPPRDKKFQMMSDEDLQQYQDKFIAKFGTYAFRGLFPDALICEQ